MDIFITQLSPWRLNTFSDDFNNEELLGILPNPELLDITRDEGEEIARRIVLPNLYPKSKFRRK